MADYLGGTSLSELDSDLVHAYSTKLTSRGAALIVKAIFSGEALQLETALWGDGGGESYEPTTDQEGVKNLCYTGGITKIQINPAQDNMLDIYVRLDSEVGGFTAREVAILDKDGVTFCAGCIPPAEKVVGTSLVSNELQAVLHVVVADASVVSFTLDDSVQYLMQRDLDKHNTDPEAHQNLWVPGCFYAVCPTASATMAKIANCPQMFSRKTGTMVRCTFQAASGANTPTLNVAGTGAAKLVELDGTVGSWQAGDEVILQFDGGRWVILLNLSEEIRRGQELRYYGVCRTVGTSQTKALTIKGFRLNTGVRVAVQFTYQNTAKESLLNISTTGAKPLKLNGENVAPGLFAAGAVLLLQYDGTAYNILGDQGAATESKFGRVKVSDLSDSTKSAADGWAASPKALASYVQTAEKAAAGGVATLDDDGKVPPSQLRGGWVLSATEPEDTTLLWILPTGVMKYYDGSAWVYVLPVWG